MTASTDLVLQPSNPGQPVASLDGELQQMVSIRGFPIRLRPPTAAAAKAGKGYITITYYELGRRKNTSGGRTLTEALDRASEIAEKLGAGTVNAPATTGELIERYLDPNRPMKSGKPWSTKHRYNTERLAKLYITPVIGKVRCKDINSTHMQMVVNKGVSADEGKRIRALLSAIITYGVGKRYLQNGKDVLLHEVYWQAPPTKKTADGGASSTTQEEGATEKVTEKTARRTVTEQGGSKHYVSPNDLPELDDIYELVVQIRKIQGKCWWWEIMPVFTAFTGLRIGELIGLSAVNVDPATRHVRVLRQFREHDRQFGPPKRGKTRSTRYPQVTPAGKHFPDGYPLGDMVKKAKDATEKRLKEWPEDKARPTERDGLLFPSARYGPWSQSNLSTRMMRPAALAAGWPQVERGKLEWAWHSLRHYFATRQLRDNNVNISVLSNVMGHATTSITMDKYVNSSAEDWQLLH